MSKIMSKSTRSRPEAVNGYGQWFIQGKLNQVVFNEVDFSLTVVAGPVRWAMGPSAKDDMLIGWRGESSELSLLDAGSVDIEPYATGYKTGIKIILGQFKSRTGEDLDLGLILTVCLEGKSDELVCNVVAIEDKTSVRQLDWPKEMDASEANYTVLSHVRGNLLPRDWPETYHPFGNSGTPALKKGQTIDTLSVIVSDHIECWSMSWWGFQQGESAMILIVESPDDASYTFSHPAGGPTVIGPRWLNSLGKLQYARSVRMCFFPKGNYVTLAKRYRKYVMDSGQFVSLKEKIARQPVVEKLVGTPHLHQWTLLKERTFTAIPSLRYSDAAKRYDPDDPEKNFGLKTFDEHVQQLRMLKADGLDRIHVTLAAWTQGGYDVGHPDPLPPAERSGGWEGMKRWVDACDELGFTTDTDDQYRDYFVGAHSFDAQFALHDEDSISRARAFPGTRFDVGWKDGRVVMMNYWAGGDMGYLNARFAKGHVEKNYRLMSEHGIRFTGVYFDVFGYVPPTEDYNPEHPQTRADCKRGRAQCFQWVRNNLGIVGTEDAADWVVPYVDYSSDATEGATVSVPLYNLVYHDAIMTPSGGQGDHLRCLLNGGYPTVNRGGNTGRLQAIMALHGRVALLEMTDHEFLDDTFRKERTTFSDGTTVTIDRDAKTYVIDPPL